MLVAHLINDEVFLVMLIFSLQSQDESLNNTYFRFVLSVSFKLHIKLQVVKHQ